MTEPVPPIPYQDAATFAVTLSRVARLDGLLLRGEITMKGEALNRLVAREGPDVVLSATLSAAPAS